MKPFIIHTANCVVNPKNKVFPTQIVVTDEETFKTAVSTDHVCATYKNNVRGNQTFILSDCIPMDCDNDHSDDSADWKTPEDVKKAFPNVMFAVGYSRNHMKEKKGKAPRPKFHCYFPIDTVRDVKQYCAMKEQLQRMFPQFDAHALDGGRLLFGAPAAAVEFHEGELTVDKLFIMEGGRNSALHKKACQLIVRYGIDEARSHFDAEAAKCVPPLEQQELESIWSSACKFGKEVAAGEGYIPPEKFGAVSEILAKLHPVDNSDYPWTEMGAGQLFADVYIDKVRYIPERKSWFYYENGIWEKDIKNLKTMELCKKLANDLMIYAFSIEDERKRQEYMKYCSKWQVRRMRETILNDAQSVHHIHITEFDSNPYILNCKNGTLDLSTMTFSEHRAADYLTRMAGAEYIPGARCERFDRFIEEITCNDAKKAKFLQKVLGYGLSGDTRIECMYIFYGATTRNGKGTLCESILKVMGSYGCTMRAESIGMKKNVNSHAPSEDIARLAGTRFVNISEPERRLMLNAALVKSMTGNDTMNARFLNENSFDFHPQFKLYINTNYRPSVNDLTLFTSNRVIVITFDKHFEQSKQDNNLKTLFAEPESQSAILNWLIEGYRMIQAEGLCPPESVKAAIAEYEKDSDKLMCFVEECLVEDTKAEVRTASVYKVYKEWCEDNGLRAESSRKLNAALRRIGTIDRKRPADGGSETTMLLGYKISGAASPL